MSTNQHDIPPNPPPRGGSGQAAANGPVVPASELTSIVDYALLALHRDLEALLKARGVF